MEKADAFESMAQERPFAFIGIDYSDRIYPHAKTHCGRDSSKIRLVLEVSTSAHRAAPNPGQSAGCAAGYDHRRHLDPFFVKWVGHPTSMATLSLGWFA
jgi:hypothetical protein